MGFSPVWPEAQGRPASLIPKERQQPASVVAFLLRVTRSHWRMVHGAVRCRGCSLGSSLRLLCGSGALAGREVPVGGAAGMRGWECPRHRPASAVCPQAAAAGSFQAGVETSPIPLLSSGTVFAVKDNAGLWQNNVFDVSYFSEI